MLTVYSRHDCHLCDELLGELHAMVRGRLPVRVRDVDAREEWRETYGWRVPYVEYNERMVCEYFLDREAISAILAAQL